MNETERLTYCRICAAACGLVVTIDDERIVKVRGDNDHPISRGYACAKGLAAGRFHHADDRLNAPSIDGQTANWIEVLDDLADRLRQIINDHGPHSVGVYLATGLAYDINGWLAGEGFIRALGTHQRYTPVTIDNAPALVAAELVSGYATLNPVWDPQRCDVLLLVGTNPVVSHGYGTALADPIRRIREFQQAGGRVVVVDPRRTETAALADVHLQTTPGTDHLLLAYLTQTAIQLHPRGNDCAPNEFGRLRATLAPLTSEYVATRTGVSPSALEQLAHAVVDANGLAVHCGTGVTMSEHGLLAEWLRWALLAATKSLDRERGMQFNNIAALPIGGRPAPVDGRLGTPPSSRPDLPRILGQHPCAALADEITHGNLRALIVCGGRPDISFPNAPEVNAALDALEVLAVIDVRSHELTARASHVLAATGQFERADVPMQGSVQYANGLQYTDAIVPPVGDRQPAWWILGSLARRLQLDALSGLDPNTTTDVEQLARIVGSVETLDAAGPRGTWSAREPGWVRTTLLPEGRWRFGSQLLLDRLDAVVRPSPGNDSSEIWFSLVNGRRIRAVNATPFQPGALNTALVRLHPDDASRHNIADGDAVTISNPNGTLRAIAHTDAHLAPGSIWCGHGNIDLNPSVFVSSRNQVDPRTGMPTATNVAVQISLDTPTI